MCGIAAIIDYSKIKPKVEEIKSMTDLLAHRGPDGEGFFREEGIALGHRRLAIIDTDHRSDQPMHREKFHLIFNGMIYNYIEIKNELIELGHKFSTTSDTEVILSAYQEWDMEAFNRFNGMWAIILYDEQKNRVICSRDRFGIKPLYYTTIGSKLFLASEIKAFRAIKKWQPKVNHIRLYEYLAFNMTDHTNETMFADVLRVPKSHHLVVDLNRNTVETLQYYDISKPDKPNDGNRFSVLFEDAIKIRTRTDVPLSSTLSGGMDSSSIVSMLAARLDTVSDTYTLAYPGDRVDESKYAQMVNDKYQIPPNLITTTEEYLDKYLDRLIYHQDEPFTGATVMAQSNIYENIHKDGYKVVLGGQGGDEILCGYDKFVLGAFKESIRLKPISALIDLFYFQKRSGFDKGQYQKLRTYGKTPSRNKWYNLSSNNKLKAYKRNSEDNVFEISYNLLFGIGISALLRYEDRNSMSYGIESRLPFLDYRLVEYCLQMSSDKKLNKGVTKKILRDTMQGIVPQEIIIRNDKMGFETPQNEWMNANKDHYLELADEAMDQMPFLNRGVLRPLLKNNNSLLWRVINAGKWINNFNLSVNE